MTSFSAFIDVGRIHVSGFGAFLALSGTAMTVASAPPQLLVMSVFAGLAVNYLAFAANNLADVDVDRLDPSRRHSPLVSGSITARGVWASIVTLASVGTLGALSVSVRASTVFALLSSATVVISYYQKRGNPVIFDMAYACVFPAVLLFGWLSTGDRPPSASVACLAVGVAVLGLQMNLCGNLKDLEFDRTTRFRTLTQLTSTRVDGSGLVRSPGALVAYGLGLQVVYGAVVASAGILAFPNPWIAGPLVLVSVITIAVATVSLKRLLLGLQPINGRGNMRFLWLNVVTFIVLTLAILGATAPAVSPVALSVLVLPALLRFLIGKRLEQSRG